MTSRSEMAATPRTDAAAGKYRPGWQEKWEDMVALSAELELELTNWRMQAELWRECATNLAERTTTKEVQLQPWQDAYDAFLSLKARFTEPMGPRVDYEYTSADVHDS